MNITDAAASDQSLLKGLCNKLPAGSYVTFDMGYVNYEAWQDFSNNDIFYVTREKRKCRYEVQETRAIPEEDKDVIVSDEIVELQVAQAHQAPNDGGRTESPPWPQTQERHRMGEGE